MYYYYLIDLLKRTQWHHTRTSDGRK